VLLEEVSLHFPMKDLSMKHLSYTLKLLPGAISWLALAGLLHVLGVEDVWRWLSLFLIAASLCSWSYWLWPDRVFSLFWSLIYFSLLIIGVACEQLIRLSPWRSPDDGQAGR